MNRTGSARLAVIVAAYTQPSPGKELRLQIDQTFYACKSTGSFLQISELSFVPGLTSVVSRG